MAPLRFIAVTATAALLLAGVALARRKDQPLVHGRVTLADGSLPQLLVTVERVCKGVIQTTAFADSQGRFQMDDSDPDGCEIRAYLPGYRSQNVAKVAEVGTLILRPRGKSDSAARSDRNKDIAKVKTAWAPFEKGLDEAAKGRWRGAEDAFESVTATSSWFAAAWLCLGMIQEREGNPVAAKKSYKQAIKVDDSFMLPYAYAAAVEVTRGDWQEALDDSNKVLQSDAEAFPGVWLANAWANLNMHRMSAAEKSAEEVKKLDAAEHRFPELEYVLGLISLDKRDPAGAREHFRNYLVLDPHGRFAGAARAEVERP